MTHMLTTTLKIGTYVEIDPLSFIVYNGVVSWRGITDWVSIRCRISTTFVAGEENPDIREMNDATII